MRMIESIEPTRWNTLKTEAIDMDSDFHWTDDRLLQSEAEVLRAHGVHDRLVIADSRSRPDDLARVIELLRERQERSGSSRTGVDCIISCLILSIRRFEDL